MEEKRCKNCQHQDACTATRKFVSSAGTICKDWQYDESAKRIPIKTDINDDRNEFFREAKRDLDNADHKEMLPKELVDGVDGVISVIPGKTDMSERIFLSGETSDGKKIEGEFKVAPNPSDPLIYGTYKMGNFNYVDKHPQLPDNGRVFYGHVDFGDYKGELRYFMIKYIRPIKLSMKRK